MHIQQQQQQQQQQQRQKSTCWPISPSAKSAMTWLISLITCAAWKHISSSQAAQSESTEAGNCAIPPGCPAALGAMRTVQTGSLQPALPPWCRTMS